MSNNLSPEQRYQEIRARLAALGDVSHWQTGTKEHLILFTPCGPIIVAYADEKTPANYDLLAFLGDAPFAIQFLLALAADQQQTISQLRRQLRAMEVPHG